jgi:multidrug efflux pump subunit AcrB
MLIELTPFSDRDIKSPEIISQLERVFAGYSEATVRLGQSDAGPPAEQYPFKVQVFGEETEQLALVAEEINSSLSNSTVTRASGTEANISETTISFTDTIARKDGRQFVEVGAAFDADDTTALVQAAREKVEAEFDSEVLSGFGLTASDLEFDFGQESDNEESFSALGPAALAALAAMFILLAIQFRSVVKPVLIFLALPFSFLGVMYGLYVTNNALSFFAMVGVIGLIGIAVNNTILLTDYANQRRRRGMGIVDSIAEASRARFRPLFTTTATTVAALAPLAMSDPFWEPLAVAIIFGLISSTFLVIMSFPYYYIAAEYLSQRVKRVFGRSAA